jgi:hypothetical protein
MTNRALRTWPSEAFSGSSSSCHAPFSKIDCSSAFFCSHEGERSSTVMGDSFKSASLSFFFFKGRVAAIQTSEGELSVKLELDLWIFELQSSILVERKQGFSEEGIIGNSALSSSD